MKKQLPGFLTGVIVSALVFTAAPAIAAQIQTVTATLNSVNIEVNGQKVAVAGENYTLDNGKQTAGSIVYNETTYVPIRKFGEIMGAEIGYDGTTGSVTVKGEVKGAVEPTTPPNTTASTDYSDWSKEDEAAYQEFKGMWKIKQVTDKFFWNDEIELIGETIKRDETDLYYMNHSTSEVQGKSDVDYVRYFVTYIKPTAEKYIPRLLDEMAVSGKNTLVIFQTGMIDSCRALKIKDGTIKTEYVDPDNYY